MLHGSAAASMQPMLWAEAAGSRQQTAGSLADLTSHIARCLPNLATTAAVTRPSADSLPSKQIAPPKLSDKEQAAISAPCLQCACTCPGGQLSHHIPPGCGLIMVEHNSDREILQDCWFGQNKPQCVHAPVQDSSRHIAVSEAVA